MSSIYEQALGPAFNKLHPQLQQKFGLHSASGMAAISRGVMREITGGAFYMAPFLKLGSKKKITFVERGKNIPFTLENYAYLDSFGRETVSWIRKFHFGDTIRHFDATMIYSEQRRSIVDFLGNSQDLATNISLSVTKGGGISLRSGGLRWYIGGMYLPIPTLFSGSAQVSEWFNEEGNLFQS